LFLKRSGHGTFDWRWLALLFFRFESPCISGSRAGPPQARIHRDAVNFGRMIHLFSYGTLRQDGVQLSSFGRLLKGRTDALPGWKQEMIEITDVDVLAKSGLRFHPIITPGSTSDEVVGMVFEITADELANADRYEVADYKRVTVRLKSGIEAWVYVRK
jgi:gamma-glutamylcyclotransferase (GGCT)/AIG2-like uncharacterized protein YtfP